MLNKLILFYTNKCNASCSHCFVSPLINRKSKSVMDDTTFNKSILLANKLNINTIVISGGEPITHYKELLKALDNCTECKNIKHWTLCTNGYWGQNYENCIFILQELLKRGFDTIEISTDSYHQKYIDFENCIIPLVNECHKNNIKVNITICYSKLEEEICSISKIKKLIKETDILKIRPISEFGSAVKNKISAEFLQYKNDFCSMVGNLCIMYDGNIYICCGPPISLNLNNYKIGDINQIEDDGIIKMINNNKTLQLIKNNSINNLYKIHMNSNSNRKYDSICSKCIELTSSLFNDSNTKKRKEAQYDI